MTLSIEAPAKLNLGLRILGLRPDGFHDIRSLFQTISLCDELHLDVEQDGSGTVRLKCEADDVPADNTNLVWKAAESFLAASGLKIDISIVLTKHIPSRAGLGGGSSDAASTLLALKRLTGSEVDLQPLAASLGSDVPFFLLPARTALVEGRGERLSPAAAIPFHAVLIHPEVEVSTPWAYRTWDSETEPCSLTDKGINAHYSALSAAWHEGKPFPQDLRNDFLPLLEKRFSEVERPVRFLRDSGVDWGLSGSGPTLYALFMTEEEALRFSRELPRETVFSLCRSAEAAGASSNW